MIHLKYKFHVNVFTDRTAELVTNPQSEFQGLTKFEKLKICLKTYNSQIYVKHGVFLLSVMSQTILEALSINNNNNKKLYLNC